MNNLKIVKKLVKLGYVRVSVLEDYEKWTNGEFEVIVPMDDHPLAEDLLEQLYLKQRKKNDVKRAN